MSQCMKTSIPLLLFCLGVPQAEEQPTTDRKHRKGTIAPHQGVGDPVEHTLYTGFKDVSAGYELGSVRMHSAGCLLVWNALASASTA